MVIEMQDKIKNATQIIRKYIKKFNISPNEIFIGHSGGKDSSVVRHLMHSIYNEAKVVHNIKKIYTKDTDKEIGKTDVDVRTLTYLYNEGNDYNICFVGANQMKEFLKTNGLKYQIDGSRKDETDRTNKSSTFETDGELIRRENMTDFNDNGLYGLKIIYPIYDWTAEDVFEYHVMNNLKLSEEYVDDEEFSEWVKKKMKG